MQTAEAIVGAGGESLVVAGDVTAEDFPGKIVKATLDRFGCIDILINNAGTSLVTPPLSTPLPGLNYPP